PPYFGTVPGVSRVMGFPQIGVAPSKGAGGGRLYVTWSDYRNGDIDVFAATSADHGRTWSTPARVNNDPIHDGLDQFFQWMAVDPITGAVYVQFYDRRADSTNRRTGVTLARSTNGGRTFTNYAWTDSAFVGRQPFLGDYTWLTAYDNRVYGIWAEAVPVADTTGTAPRRPRREGTVVEVGTADFTGVR
ncbi:MAG TPA: sialidase family protein, partial [Gemmatimonadaceae bacterium]|nr:sialidase family protein [Gemmatimonadaceae bacterium]